ncbi:MAG: recombination regulator RecX [Gammaproteobacteria bacterium]|nr:recombination regulator RecX [Gammaproteobacteria bacterium]
MMSHPDSTQIKTKCLELLARREMTRLELVNKLTQRGFDVEAVHAVIDELHQQGWQSDQRFTEQYIAMRASKGYGPVRIKQELQERGIEQTDVEQSLPSQDWQIYMLKAYRKKFSDTHIIDWPERAKRMRFLSYRGYTAEQINTLLNTEYATELHQ